MSNKSSGRTGDPSNPVTQLLPITIREKSRHIEFADHPGAGPIITKMMVNIEQAHSDLSDVMLARGRYGIDLENELRGLLGIKPDQSLQYAETDGYIVDGVALTGTALEGVQRLSAARFELRILANAYVRAKTRILEIETEIDPVLDAFALEVGMVSRKYAVMQEWLVAFDPGEEMRRQAADQQAAEGSTGARVKPVAQA